MNIWLIAVLFGVAVLLALCWWVPKQQIKQVSTIADLHPKDRAELEDEFRKNITQALGRMLVLGSVTLAFYQMNDARRAAVEQTKTALLSQGVQLIGKDNSQAEHVAGLLILQDWAAATALEGDHITDRRHSILKPVLEGFIRDVTGFAVNAEDCNLLARSISDDVSTEVKAAANVLKEVSLSQGVKADFSGLNLSRVDFSGANLSGSNFAFADLSEANFQDADI